MALANRSTSWQCIQHLTSSISSFILFVFLNIFGKLLLSVNIGSFIEPMTLITTIGSGIQLHHFSLEASVGRLYKTNKSLGTHLQFLLALTYQFPKTPVFIGVFHVSNGNDFFNTGLPNHGEDYINVGYRYRF